MFGGAYRVLHVCFQFLRWPAVNSPVRKPPTVTYSHYGRDIGEVRRALGDSYFPPLQRPPPTQSHTTATSIPHLTTLDKKEETRALLPVSCSAERTFQP